MLKMRLINKSDDFNFLEFIISIVLILLVSNLSLSAQNHNNIWYFGDHAGLDFNSGSPVTLTNGALSTFEGCACISDSLGNILFYTDGNTIYNKNHVAMANGTGLMGNSTSTQSAIIVPEPLSTTEYYVFTIDAFAGPNGFRYSTVDMTANAGLGAVTQKNIPVFAPTTEKICAIKHADDINVWIVTHEWQNNNFRAYLLTSAGLTGPPVITSIGTPHSNSSAPNNNAVGYMKASPDHERIALGICDTRIYEIFDFDRSTGMLSNAVTLSNPDGPAASSRCYALEFSPNSRYLYTLNVYSNNIYQFDLINYNQAAIQNSKVQIGTLSGTQGIYFSGAIQLGPDNKIYVCKYNTDQLAAVNNPDGAGSACAFLDNAVDLQGKLNMLGLPSMVSNNFLAPLASSQGCYLGPYSFSVNTGASVISYSWHFNDPGATSDTSSLASPTHVFSGPGTYIVNLTLTMSGGAVYNINLTVSATLKPQLFATDTAVYCTGGNYTVQPQGSWQSYYWSTGQTSPNITVSTGGHYYLTVTDADSCLVSDSLFLDLVAPLSFSLGKDTSLCTGDSLVLNPLITSIYTSIYWENGSTAIPRVVYGPGTYILTAGNICGLFDDTIVIASQPSVTVQLPADSVFCTADSIFIIPLLTGPYDSLKWENGLQQSNRWLQIPGTYHLTAWNNCGLSTDTINLSTYGLLGISLPGDTSLCQGDSLLVIPQVSGIYDSLLWENGSHQLQRYLHAPGSYSIKLWNPCDSVQAQLVLSLIPTVLVTLPPDTTLCTGSSIYIEITPSGPYTSLYWENGDSSLYRYITQPGLYFVHLNSACGISGDSIIITELSTPVINLGNDTTICIGDEYILEPYINGDYDSLAWDDGTTQLSRSIREQGTYTIILFSSCGTAADTVTVNAKDCDSEIWFPNCFTPNGDGKNETFGPIYYNIGPFEMYIYNRWGELIFETRDILNTWDGTYKGRVCPVGVYYWLARYIILRPKSIPRHQAHGIVTLLR